MNAMNSRLRTLGVLMAMSTLVIVAASRNVIAQNGPASDRLLILGVGGAPIFDNSILEPAPAGLEPTLTFTGGPAPVAPPIPPFVAIGIPGVSIVVLTEPATEVPAPGEIIITIPGSDGQRVILSDVIISTLIVQPTVAPPFITLVSDGGPDLDQIATLLPGLLGVIYLPETGLLQDLTAILPGTIAGGPFGPISVFVRSDLNVPEPSSAVLASFGLLGLAAWGWRRRKR